MNLLPQQSTFPPPAETLIFEFPLRADFIFIFFPSKVIQQTQQKHIQKALYCERFVMFESFGELIDLRHRREHGTLEDPRLAQRPSAPPGAPIGKQLQKVQQNKGGARKILLIWT